MSNTLFFVFGTSRWVGLVSEVNESMLNKLEITVRSQSQPVIVAVSPKMMAVSCNDGCLSFDDGCLSFSDGCLL